MSMYSLLAGLLRFFFTDGSLGSEFALEVVGILRVPLTDMAIAGTVPVPVAAIIAGSACSSNHLMVSPSDLWPSSLVSWKILAAQVAGIRILLPRPSTLVCRSFPEGFLGGAAGTWTATGITQRGRDDLSSVSGSSFGATSFADNVDSVVGSTLS